MRRNELVEALRAGHFRPFRLYLSDGGTFDVRHPEMLMVGQHAAVIGIVRRGDNGDSGKNTPKSSVSRRWISCMSRGSKNCRADRYESRRGHCIETPAAADNTRINPRNRPPPPR